MPDQELVPDLPLVPPLLGAVVGQVTVAVAAVPVVLIDDRDPVLLLVMLGVAVVFWAAWAGLETAFFRRPVIRERVRRVPGPVPIDEQRVRAAFWSRALVSGAFMLVMALLCWALGSLEVAPVVLLGLAGFSLVEIRRLRRWQAHHGVVLFTEQGASHRLRPVGPRDPDKLLAVVTPSLATAEDRS